MGLQGGGATIDFAQFVTWAFMTVLCSIAAFTVKVLTKMQTSIETLNRHVYSLLKYEEIQKGVNDKFERRLEKIEGGYERRGR